MTTSERSPPNDFLPMEFPLTLSVAASPAKTSVSLDQVEVSTEPGRVFGQRLSDWSLHFDPSSYSWKMSQRSLVEGSDVFSETWPRSGMMRNGVAYGVERSEPHKIETGSGLLPTLCKSEFRDSSKARILAAMDKGGRVARRICSRSLMLRSSEMTVSLNPSFAEWMTGYPIGHTELPLVETASSLKSRK